MIADEAAPEAYDRSAIYARLATVVGSCARGVLHFVGVAPMTEETIGRRARSIEAAAIAGIA